MREAGVGLLGLHDFAAFCKAREGATTIRQLQTCQIERVGQVVELTLRADAFCHSMVRSLTGGLVEVGLGRRDPAWLVGLLDTPTRAGDVRVMPAKGLVLAEVGYPPDGQLAARNAAARSVRQLPKDGCC
ncbi:MAG: hypothetical protein LBR32_03470 [Propionibacteriaceae bacterium]|nr:hypothetical protein [Propionibacteriaceae bacterium]